MATWEDKCLYDRVMESFGFAKDRRTPYEGQWDMIVEYMRPDLTTDTDKEGHFAGSKIYEGTSAYAPQIMEAGFRGNMYGPSIPWRRGVIRDRRFKGVDEINSWIQARDEHLESTYRRSTFYTASRGFTLSGITIGSPVMFVEEQESTGRTYYRQPHYKHVWLNRNIFGEVDTVFHEEELYLREIMRRYGDDNEVFSEAISKEIREGKFSQKHKILRVTFVHEDPIFDRLKEGETEIRPRRPWVSFDFLEGATIEKEKKPLLSEGYWSCPFVCWDVGLNVGEMYARSFGWWAIWDAVGGQGVWKSLYQIAETVSNPPMWLLKKYLGQVSFMPGARNGADPGDIESAPTPLQTGQNYPITTDFADRITHSTERWFRVKFFTMLLSLPDEGKAPPSVFQIAGMLGERATLLSTAIESCEDYLRQTDNRQSEIEVRAGRMPMPWEFGLDLDDKLIESEFIGLFSQSQKINHRLRTIMMGLAGHQQLQGMEPLLQLKLRWADLDEYILETSNFPQEIIVPKDEFQQAVADYLQRQQVQEQLASGLTAAQTVSELGKPLAPASPMGMLAGVGA